MSISPSRQQREFKQPAADGTVAYLEAAIGGVLAADAAFFAHAGRRYRARVATPAEVRLIQAIERRLLEPTACVPIVLVHLNAEGARRRVVVEAYGFDVDTMRDEEVRALFEDVVKHGWTAIERGQA